MNFKSYLIIWSIFCLPIVGTSAVAEPDNNSEIVIPIVEEEVVSVDGITLKQKEMRDTTVLIRTQKGRGSGTIISRNDTDINGLFEYRVLTNSHVTYMRFIKLLQKVDSITGRVKANIIDTGCKIIIFDHPKQDWKIYDSKIVEENFRHDIAILLFKSDQELSVAKIADENMMEQVRVFDEVFAIGCQLGQVPSPTTGIISQILTKSHGEKEWVIYGSTAQVTPGSSGGGLFKMYDGHYRLIGIPFRIAVSNEGQLIPHLAHAISISTAKDFIDKNSGQK